MRDLSTLVVLLLMSASAPAFAQSPAAPHAQADPPASVRPAAPASAPAVPDTSWAALFRGLGTDFRQLPSWTNAAILGVGGGLSAAAHHDDVQVTRRMVASGAFEIVFEPGEGIGNGAVQAGAAVGVYLWGREAGSPRTALVGADLVRAQIVSATLTEGVKLVVRRERPNGSSYSFPSGHTSSTFATATVLQRKFGWRVGAPAFAVATLVGGSRLQENRHYLSDVVFGAAIGIVAGRGAELRHGHATLALAPFAAPGGGGFLFSLTPHAAS